MPTASERARTAQRLAAHELARLRPDQPTRSHKCNCGAYRTCQARLRARIRAAGGELGYWRSERARAARDLRLTGMRWVDVAAALGYANCSSAYSSAILVARSEEERDELRARPLRVGARMVVAARPTCPSERCARHASWCATISCTP